MDDFALINKPLFLILNQKEIGLRDEQVVMLILIDALKQLGINYPSPKDLCDYNGKSEKENEEVLSDLIVADYISIDSSGNSVSFSLSPVFEKLKKIRDTKLINENAKRTPRNLTEVFERKILRELTSIESQIITGWDEDGISVETMESVIGKLNFTKEIPFAEIETIIRNL